MIQMAAPTIAHPEKATRAFTLIELLVTMVIISIVAGLALSGLGSSKQRSKIDKTKSTIRKLHEIIMPQYESYPSRRVNGATPLDRLTATRLLLVEEMPDQWADVYWLEDTNGNGVLDPPSGGFSEDTNPNSVLDMPRRAASAAAWRYAAYKTALARAPGTSWALNSNAYQGAECLAMLVTRGGFSPDATEAFRTDEIGDIDGDGAPEFWDGWGRPIGFIRWPAGYVAGSYGWNRAGRIPATPQVPDTATNPDPFDPQRVSLAVQQPPLVPSPQRDYAVFPLIYSAGPDESLNPPNSTSSGYGIETTGTSWLAPAALSTTRRGTVVSGTLCLIAGDIRFDPNDPTVFVEAEMAVRDNITNHDLISR